MLKGGAWYLVAAVGDDVRTYKVSNIARLDVHDHRFERPAGFDLAAYWAESLARFERDLRPMVARLGVSPEGCIRLARLGAYAADAVAAGLPGVREGWFTVDLPIETIDQAALLILGLGPEVEIVVPGELRERVHGLAKQIATLAG